MTDRSVIRINPEDILMAHKRYEDPEVRRRQILDAARKALLKKSFRQLSMDDVAHAGGISKGLLYLYFKDKDALFAEVVRDMATAFRHHLEELPPFTNARQGLEDLIRAILQFGEEYQQMTTQFVGEQLLSSPHATTLKREWTEILKAITGRLQACVKAGLLREHALDLSAEVLVEVSKIYLNRKYIHHLISRPLVQYAPEIADFFIQGFGRPGRKVHQ
jgi:AcrR family transcriptional regulator